MGRLLAVILSIGLAACGAESRVDPPASDAAAAVFEGRSMGTSWCVKLAGLPAAVERASLATELADVLASVDERMSTYRADSELSRFNASRSTDWFVVSADTAAVVAAALEISARTGGAFDVTAGPLVNLWGFGPEPRPARVPTTQELTRARASTGYKLLEARAQPPALRMRAAERYVDLSGLAKGFAVDALARQLDARGIGDYLVEVGGELRARGRRSAREPWKVGLERPPSARSLPPRAIALEDRAVATSGHYRNFRTLGADLDGVVADFAHILDPRSGRPARAGVASATVVCDSAMEADALATALMVLGAEAGLRFAEREGLAVRLVLHRSGGLTVHATPAFENLVIDAPEARRSAAGTFLAAFGLMLLAMLGLAAGLLLRGRPLRGSCRGEEAPGCAGCEQSPRVSARLERTPRMDAACEHRVGRA